MSKVMIEIMINIQTQIEYASKGIETLVLKIPKWGKKENWKTWNSQRVFCNLRHIYHCSTHEIKCKASQLLRTMIKNFPKLITIIKTEIWKAKKLKMVQILYNKNKVYSYVKHNQSTKIKLQDNLQKKYALCRSFLSVASSYHGQPDSKQSYCYELWIKAISFPCNDHQERTDRQGPCISLVRQYILRELPSNHNNFCRKMCSTTLQSSRWKKNVQGTY